MVGVVIERHACDCAVDGSSLEAAVEDVESEECVRKGLVLGGSGVGKEAGHVQVLSRQTSGTLEPG